MRTTLDWHQLPTRRRRQHSRMPAWTAAQAAQTTPRPATTGPAHEPVDVLGGQTVFSEAVGGHRIELLDVTAGGYVIAINGEVVDTLPDSLCAAAAAFGRYVGAVDSRPVLRLVEVAK